jgi:hypothetical protein
MTREIGKWLRRATPQEWSEGLQWYDATGQWLRELADATGHPFETVVGVFATLSPGTSLKRNMFEASAMLQGVEIQYSTYGTQVSKAREILAGTRSPVPTGQKVMSFYLNLLGDGSAVTVDRHALRVAGLKGDKVLTPKQYNALAQAYHKVAKRRKLKGYQVQAITWLVYRRVVRLKERNK